MKTCCKCKESKNYSEFNKKSSSKDGYQPFCRGCSKAQYKAYYNKSDSERIRLYSSNKTRRDILVGMIRSKKSVPCADCKTSYPYYVMDFDHQRDKTFTIARAVVEGRSIEAILKEIEKCEVVCANCHRIRTHGIIEEL